MTEEAYFVARDEEPEKFFALCDENLRLHRQVIQESHDALREAGVPEEYIFVIQVNRDDGGRKQGDITPYAKQDKLERDLELVKRRARLCHSPDVFIFLCVDVRDQATMGRHIDTDYFSEAWFNDMVADIPH